jgi:ketosteroid isomerase-like protein
MKLPAFFLLLTALALPVEPQQRANPERQREAMKRLEFLVGQWRGEATTVVAGVRKRLNQTEAVRFRLDGLVLLVEGTGRDPETGASAFSALATIAFDETSGTYRFRAHSDGNYLDTEMIVRENGVEWGYSRGPAVITNVMKLDGEGRWIEFTDVSVNGGPPRRVTEIQVSREASPLLSPGVEADAATREALARVKTAIVEGHRTRNRAALDALYAPDYVAYDSRGLRTKGELLEALATDPEIVEGRYELTRVRRWGSIAVASGRGRMTSRQADGSVRRAEYDSVNVFELRDGRWWYSAAYLP